MISVCVATCNGEAFIRPQLESIARQLSATDEIVISDDASTDATLAIAATISGPRMIILRREAPRSIIRNFSHALSHAHGDIIFLADQDDIWEKDRVARTLPLLKNVLLTLCDCSLVDANNIMIHSSLFSFLRVRRGYWYNLLHNGYTGSCMAFRRELLRTILPIPDPVGCHDQWIGLLAEMHKSVCLIPHSFVRHRIHGANASPVGTGRRLPIFSGIIMRIHLLVFTHTRLRRQPKDKLFRPMHPDTPS